MKIGVVIPAYNGERYVADCIGSLLAQTHEDWEAYVMDDGSRDGTLAALKEFAERDGRINVWSQPNHGLVPTMNTLLDRLDDSIELVAFLDIDDFIHPQAYETLSAALERTGADVAECSIVHVLDGADFATMFDAPLGEVRERVIDDMSVYWLRRTAPGGWINKQNKLYRRSAIRGLRFQPTLSYEDDYFFACEVNASIRRKVKLDAALYAYRANPDSATAAIPFREYVRATLERISLSCAVFLDAGRVPKALEAEYRADLAKDAYRMCIRKNLKKNRNEAERRELFAQAGEAFARLEREHGFAPVGLNPLQRLVYSACRRGRYDMARLLVAFT
jgi:glycosyltransferase involved in cell wall biosynthesis